MEPEQLCAPLQQQLSLNDSAAAAAVETEEWQLSGQPCLSKTSLDANGRPHGPKTVYLNGRPWKFENYEHGVLQGECMDWYPASGKKRSSWICLNGKLHGVCVVLYENGNLHRRTSYENDQKHGLRAQCYENGNKWKIENYDHGLKHGLCEEWDENGRLSSRSNYEHGKLHGFYQAWYGNGQLWTSENYDHGTRTELRRWDDNGQIVLEQHYNLHSVKHGVQRGWTNAGVLWEEDYYENGLLISELPTEKQEDGGR
jgi:antitoxin component YwqK of YwqJK toxin-antitoxin module